MRKDGHARTGHRLPKTKRFQLSKRLTPNECQALGLVLFLFLLGVLVRWYRLAHVR